MTEKSSELSATGSGYLDKQQKIAWLRLIRTENVGPITFRMLVNKFGGAVNALENLPTISARGGLRRVINIYSEDQAKREIERASELGLRLIAMGEPEYPKLLFPTEGAPPLLYAKGNLDILSRHFIAVIGSRNCSALGRKMTQIITKELCQSAFNFAIVSGMAKGIDSVAHEHAMNFGTAAVMAGGANVIYPPENEKLYKDIADRGVIISEMPPDYQAHRGDFPRRNRIISGMSLGTIVTEATLRSGSLITARIANEQGREVFAVPGSPLDPRAEGTNALLRNGATLLLSAADVLEVLSPLCSPPLPQIEFPLAEESYGSLDRDIEFDLIKDTDRERVIRVLSPSPTEISDIIRFAGIPSQIVLGILLEMELAGRISRYHGQRISYIVP